MTFFLIKPDAVERDLIGTILTVIELKGFRIRMLKMEIASHIRLLDHYREHVGKPFFQELIASMCDQRVVAGVLEHRESPDRTITLFRELMGPFENPGPYTLRGMFALDFRRNSIHGSADAASAERETKVWFGEDF